MKKMNKKSKILYNNKVKF